LTAPDSGSFFIEKMETKNISLSFTFAYPRVIDRILAFDPQIILQKLSQFFQMMYSNVETQKSNFSERLASSSFSPKFNKKFDKKKVIRFLLPVLLLVVVIGSIAALLNRPVTTNTSNTSNGVLAAKNRADKVEVAEALATMKINKSFTFPIKDERGRDVDTFNYIVESAELRDEIVVKGQRATSVEGRTFLILNLKIVNKSSQRVGLNTRDYVRLSVNGKEDELLAPDVHNDPVEIQAISTKYTRLGFPINDKDSKLKLSVGEIDGKKENVDIKFN
jgi:hypothetical protein